MLKKILLGLLAVVLTLLLLVIFQTVSPEQKDVVKNPHVFPDTLHAGQYDLDSLRRKVGENKGLPEGFEKAALIAYSAYPELKDVHIDMELTTSGAPMESNFSFWSLLGPGKDRKYRILLNNGEDTLFDPVLLRELPFDAQVGILAHELGHVAYYHQLNTLQIAKWGLMYLVSDDFRARHEKSTDLMPVYHGLGSQIYQYHYYIRHDATTRPLYDTFGKFVDRYYLTDEEVLKAWKEHALYNHKPSDIIQ